MNVQGTAVIYFGNVKVGRIEIDLTVEETAVIGIEPVEVDLATIEQIARRIAREELLEAGKRADIKRRTK